MVLNGIQEILRQNFIKYMQYFCNLNERKKQDI